jgi:hypothetical protein
MPKPEFDYDVISQPAMPPPPPQPRDADGNPGLAKSADPRHNAQRGDQR